MSAAYYTHAIEVFILLYFSLFELIYGLHTIAPYRWIGLASHFYSIKNVFQIVCI